MFLFFCSSKHWALHLCTCVGIPPSVCAPLPLCVHLLHASQVDVYAFVVPVPASAYAAWLPGPVPAPGRSWPRQASGAPLLHGLPERLTGLRALRWRGRTQQGGKGEEEEWEII